MAIPTFTMSLSTTCLVVTQPASTDTMLYSSGQVGFFPATTYTAPKTVLRTHEATIEARCFTLGPGQTGPPAVSHFSASCSTDYYPGSTETTTYTSTPGQATDIHCEAVRDVYNPATCDTVTPLAWASLILTFITVHLTWWVFDVPILWKKRPADEGHNPYPENNLTRTKRDAVKANDRLGLGGFLLSIAWACLRANAPGCAALYALMAGRDTGDYAAIYYLGVRRLRDGRAPEFTTWKLTTSIGTDLLSLVRVALALLLWRFDRPNDGWFFPVICYGAMAFPAVLFGVPFILLATAYGCFSRVGGVTLAAWQHYAGGQPFCKIPGIGFAVVYLTLGGISALLALLAIVLYQTDMGWWLSYSSLDPQVKLAGGSDLGRNIGERREGTVVLM